jgi:hypothetical protein
MTSETMHRPRPGPQDPVRETPPRPPESVRRTTTTDTTFPDGGGGRVELHVRGRDLHTDVTGGADVRDAFSVDFALEPWSGTIVGVDASVTSTPLDALDGVPFRGLRRRVADLLPDDAARRSLCFSVLEDLGGAYLVSGYSRLRAGLIPGTPELAEFALQLQGDICVGWALDGPVIEAVRRTSNQPVPMGPAAPALEGDDPLSWHEIPSLSPEGVRRRRRTDVWRPATGRGALQVQHHFRDSYVGTHGEEVMHEYLVDAVFDDARRVVSVEAQARVLPWYACPGAVRTAQQLVGMDLEEIAARVTSEFTGVTTCTHLNSTLRTLADAASLELPLS